LLKNLDTDWRTPDADTTRNATVFFNLCHYADASACASGKEDAFAYRLDKAGNCEMLTSDTPQAEITEIVSRDDPQDP